MASLAGAFSVVLAMAFPLTAQALDWRLTPSVGASATYTDNANQSATNPEDALILSVTPGFIVAFQWIAPGAGYAAIWPERGRTLWR